MSVCAAAAMALVQMKYKRMRMSAETARQGRRAGKGMLLGHSA